MEDDGPVEHNGKSGLEQISAVALERRQRAQTTLQQQQPDWLLQIRQTEVTYVISPVALPLKHASFKLLLEYMSNDYQLRYQLPPLPPMPDGRTLTAEEVGTWALNSLNTSIEFHNGRFPITSDAGGRLREDFVPIRKVSITDQSVFVVVEGISKVAELVATEVVELLWRSTGIQKRWDDVRRHLSLVTYATLTIVDLGFPFEALLNANLVSFIEQNVLDGRRYAAFMGANPLDKIDGDLSMIQCAYSLDELHLLFHRFNSRNGRAETTQLNFSMLEASSRRTGRVLIGSLLPFDEHVDCIGELREALAPN